ncbi:hypothetical protein TorRG33x02_009830, partial [Trema orientale]
MEATLISNNEINRVAIVVETRKWQDSSTDNASRSITGGRGTIGSDKGDNEGHSCAQEDTTNGQAKASRNTTVDIKELLISSHEQ